jgi:cyanophycin synthetase
MKQKTLPPVVPQLLIERMASLARERSIPVIPPTRNNPVLQFGQGIHGRRFSMDALASLQARLVAGESLAFGQWLDQEFPLQQDGSRGRIPTVGITGSVGKTTTAHMVATILRESGRSVALSTTQGSWVAGKQLHRGDLAGGYAAISLLRNPRVDAGVFEWARGGLIKHGIVIDSVNVAAVLNVHDNHLGLNGVNTREQLAKVKRIVAEHAEDLVVLNADDPLCMAMLPFLKSKRVGLVSRSLSNRDIERHRNAGGLVVTQEGEAESTQIVFTDKREELGRIGVVEIPDSFGGRFMPAAVNASFAMAIAHGLGVSITTIHSALKRFVSSLVTNPGRNNLLQGLPFTLLVSHADGPIAMRALVDFASTLHCPGRRRLLICSVGDRPDSFIESMARQAAGKFTDYICTDFGKGRGRPQGEAASLLGNALIAAGVSPDLIRVLASPDEACQQAYADLGPHDLIVDNSFDNRLKPWLKQRGLEAVTNQYFADE